MIFDPSSMDYRALGSILGAVVPDTLGGAAPLAVVDGQLLQLPHAALHRVLFVRTKIEQYRIRDFVLSWYMRPNPRKRLRKLCTMRRKRRTKPVSHDVIAPGMTSNPGLALGQHSVSGDPRAPPDLTSFASVFFKPTILPA